VTEGQAEPGGEPTTKRAPGSHRRRPAEPERVSQPRRAFSSGFVTLRDLASFVLGAGIVVHEVISPSVELFAMGAGLSLMGLPFALAADEKRKGD
jgi:hypothetical protein